MKTKQDKAAKEVKTELQQEFSDMRNKGKKIYKSLGNIAKSLDWKDYLTIGVAGAAAVYAFRKRNAILSMAAPIVVGLVTEGIAKAKDLRQELAHA